jgi:hypothetical protein
MYAYSPSGIAGEFINMKAVASNDEDEEINNID